MRQTRGISHIHIEIKTELKGDLMLLWGRYKDCYGKNQKELLFVNPTHVMIDSCKSILKDGPADLRVDGPGDLEYAQYHLTNE